MLSGETPGRMGPIPHSDEAFQKLLLQLSMAAARGVDASSLIRQFCSASRVFFGVDGAYFWQLASAGELVGTEADGLLAERFRGIRLSTDKASLGGEAIRARRTVYANHVDPARSALSSIFEVQAAMAAPLVVSNEAIGAVVFLHASAPDFFNDDLAAKATILAGQLGNLLEATRLTQASREQRLRAESLMELALDLNSRLLLPELGKRVVARAVAMMGAGAAALALKQESGLEPVILQNGAGGNVLESPLLQRFSKALAEALSRHAQAIVTAPAGELLGPELASTLHWDDCILLRLLNPSGELAGVICLANRGKTLSRDDEQLLQTIAGHASIALENARLFSRMDRANRHWMEIFDAISDFIVVHDGADNIMRVNRSLANFIGVPPAELIGVNMCTLLAMDNAALLRACPFCRGGDETDEYVHPVLGSTYLVSTSRVHGASNEGLQTIHVLKDITDRREAERRYRELFDNIQEGLFFSNPEGGFVEVNDALVRMLGYSTREELLHVDISTQVYGSTERYQEFAAPMQAHGVVRNHEEALRRKDGSTVHVMINAFAVRDPQGRITQYRGLMLDISDLKAFQVELQRERDFSGKILNNTQSLILVTDTAGLVSYANRRWQDMGYEQAQVLGAPLEQLVAPVRRQAFKDAFTAILGGQQVDNLDLQILRGDGRVGQFSVNLS